MNINLNKIVSMTEANQNFSKVARLAEKAGEVIVFKNNKPRFKIVKVGFDDELALSDDEKIDVVAKRVLKRFLPAFTELAK